MNKDFNILVVEDDDDINRLITTILKKEGYNITSAFSGTEASLLLSMNKYDLLILDLMLPGLSGESLIKKIREDNISKESNIMPIIVLTAKGLLDDKVNVLGLGADDYMTKPFEIPELLARVNAQLRRYSMFKKEVSKTNKEENTQKNYKSVNVSNVDDKSVIAIKNLKLNAESMSVCINDNPIDLTTHEFKILKILMENPQRVYSKEKLYEVVWKNGYYGEDNTVSVHVSNIRKKISQFTNDEYIKTVWGIGYKINL